MRKRDKIKPTAKPHLSYWHSQLGLFINKLAIYFCQYLLCQPFSAPLCRPIGSRVSMVVYIVSGNVVFKSPTRTRLTSLSVAHISSPTLCIYHQQQVWLVCSIFLSATCISTDIPRLSRGRELRAGYVLFCRNKRALEFGRRKTEDGSPIGYQGNSCSSIQHRPWSW